MHLRPTKQNGNPICPANRDGVSPAIRDQLGGDDVQPVLDTQALRSGMPVAIEYKLNEQTRKCIGSRDLRRPSRLRLKPPGHFASTASRVEWWRRNLPIQFQN